MLADSLVRLRLISFLEGLSFLVLLWCAVVEKRLRGHEEAIQVPGMVHGVLFLLFCLALLHAWADKRIGLERAAIGFVCSLLPLAPFWFEHSLRQRKQRQQATAAGDAN